MPRTRSGIFMYIVPFNLQENSEGVVYNLDYCVIIVILSKILFPFFVTSYPNPVLTEH